MDKEIKIDKNTLAPEEFENFKTITNDEGDEETVYISRAGNIVTPPQDRAHTDLNQQQLCWDLYVKSWRSGTPSAQQAARDAGYAENTALNITNQKWFKLRKKRLGRSNMVDKAERNLSHALDVAYSKMKLVEGKEIEEIDKDLFKTVVDVSKYITGTLAKDEGYSTKTEVQGKMDNEIKINSISYADPVLPVEVENKLIDNNIKQTEEIIIDAVIKENENKNNIE